MARPRVTLCQEGVPERTVGFVRKPSLGATPAYSYAISNAPVSTPWRLLLWLSGVRWAIAQGVEESQTALGLAHYEIRPYPGWHPHRLTTRLAHCFLWHWKLRVGKKSACMDGITAADLVGRRLPATDVHD